MTTKAVPPIQPMLMHDVRVTPKAVMCELVAAMSARPSMKLWAVLTKTPF